MGDSLLDNYFHSAIVKTHADHWEIVSKEDFGSIKDLTCSVSFDYALQRFTYNTPNGLPVIIDYKDFTYSPSFSPLAFNELVYLDPNGGLNDRFKDYQLTISEP